MKEFQILRGSFCGCLDYGDFKDSIKRTSSPVIVGAWVL